MINETTITGSQQVSNVSIGSYGGAKVSFTITRPGTVMITATVDVNTVHAAGSSTEVELGVANTTSGFAPGVVIGLVGSVQPSDDYVQDFSLVHTWVITTPGTYTYYVNAVAFESGTDTSYFISATIAGVFYPS